MTEQHVALMGILAVPGVTLLSLLLRSWFNGTGSEGVSGRIVVASFGVAALLDLYLLGYVAWHAGEPLVVHVGPWFHVGHYAFSWTLLGDYLSLTYAALASVLLAVIGIFSSRYLHREQGYHRFFLLLALFGFGVLLVALAGSLDAVFFGWELVGLSSALLIAFFCEREAPVRHGFRAFMVYRFCDIGLLSAAAWLHHVGKTLEFESLSGWFRLPETGEQTTTTVLAVLLIWASLGKGALFPLGGWLPRAMEGPTPSSAIFYGALSIHLAPFLLLRCAELVHASAIATGLLLSIGALTAVHGAFVGSVQTDVKSSLAYGSMSQVGLIMAEVALGWDVLALAHVVGHASLRSVQILRSPNIIQDFEAFGCRPPMTRLPLTMRLVRRVSPVLEGWLYRFALERGYFDAFLRDYILRGSHRLLTRLAAVEDTLVRYVFQQEQEVEHE